MVRVDHLEPDMFIKNSHATPKLRGMLIDPDAAKKKKEIAKHHEALVSDQAEGQESEESADGDGADSDSSESPEVHEALVASGPDSLRI